MIAVISQLDRVTYVFLILGMSVESGKLRYHHKYLKGYLSPKAELLYVPSAISPELHRNNHDVSG